jgi:hypothetical protein
MGSTPPHPHDFARQHDGPATTHPAAAPAPVEQKAPQPKQTPSLGRVVLVGVRNARGDFFVRPAMMVQIGPVRVDDEDQDQVGLHVFHAPADGPSKDNYVVGHLRDPSKPWEPGDWEWPQRQ